MTLQGDIAENWRDFEQAWGHYVIATSLVGKMKKTDGSADPAGMQLVASTLCSVMGRECMKIMYSLPTLSNDDRNDPDKILKELHLHFVPQRHVLFERYKFNTASQQSGDTMDDYVVRLRQLADSCEFGILKDSLIRDRLVIGTSDTPARERLLRERPVPDLNRCIESLRACELSRAHKQQIDGTKEFHGSNVNQVKHGKNKQYAKRKPGKPTHVSGQHTSYVQSTDKKCNWCGRSSHPRSACPAREAKCNACKGKGHYAVVCRTKNKVQEIRGEEDDYNSFLGEVTNKEKNHWQVLVNVDNYPCQFKLDTGAEVTVLSDSAAALRHLKIATTPKTLKGPGQTKLNVLGAIDALLSVGGRTHQETVYVVQDQDSSLLSIKACRALELLTPSKEVYQVKDNDPNFREEFPELFTGLGKLEMEHHITLRHEVEPLCLYTARRVPHPLLPQVKEQLEKMEKQGVISPVTDPTQWCSGMVVVRKPNGGVRICVDLTTLNKDVAREVHPMKSVDDNLAKLQGSQIYTKLDANSGFWQIPLDKDSRLFTTFITPTGRFCFNRLPFGISSAPEIFQRMMSNVLHGLEGEGVICHMDDILVHGQNVEQHDRRVRLVLARLRDAGITLNEKCEFSKREIRFLGHIVTPDGIQVDQEKTKAIRGYPPPGNVTELQRFLGMVNQVAKFIEGLAAITEPLRRLLRKEMVWLWDSTQQEAFNKIKDKLVSSETLAHYNPERTTFLAADACNNGLGAVLLQLQDDGTKRPICYASRSLTDTEKRYAVIEKEALAATWACEKFKDYITGLQFELQTDHKPLVPLLSSKDLSQMPPRILRFRLRMMRYAPTIIYVPGKEQITADALSRAPSDLPAKEDASLISEVEEFARQTIAVLPATEVKLQEIRKALKEDEVCVQVSEFCKVGWPAYIPDQPLLRPYWSNRQHLTLVDDLLLYDDRLVIPTALRMDILERIHHGHLGITKCRARARESVWWPSLSVAIEDMVKRCLSCLKSLPERREPLMTSPLPEGPWERVGSDLFEYDKKVYLLVVDYFSRWIEIRPLVKTNTEGVVNAISSIFAVHGIPDIVVSDNGPQYASKEFQSFAKKYGFTQVTSSPGYPQSNGEAERAVRTIKNILNKCNDLYLGLLAYRSSPLQNGRSPAELLMGRKLRTTIPALPVSRKQDKELFRKEEQYRTKQAQCFNQRHSATKELPQLHDGDVVWLRDQHKSGHVLTRSSSPRSYIVETDQGTTLRRNRGALIALGETDNSPIKCENQPPIPTPIPTSPREDGTMLTRKGRVVKPPKRLDL